MTLAEIAKASGVPARTIRFYIARGLLQGPVKSGRGALYGEEHLARLNRIRHAQSEGRTLSEIARMFAGTGESEIPSPSAWWQHAIADDVVIFVKAGASPWRTRQIRAAVEEFARRVIVPNSATEEGES